MDMKLKASWGELEIKDVTALFEKPRLNLEVTTDILHGKVKSSGWCYLTKAQAVRLGEKLVEWGSKG